MYAPYCTRPTKGENINDDQFALYALNIHQKIKPPYPGKDRYARA